VVDEQLPAGLFPARARFATRTADLFEERFYAPLFHGVQAGLGPLRWLQQGTVQLYIFYIAMALLALMVWKFR
jgi:hypothetical protein